jgi:hypothetical protein
MENNQQQLEDKILAEIKSGQLKLRSKYVFLAEKLGLGSAFALSALLASLVFSLALFYLKASDNLIYLSFGSRGLFAFLESFPYLLVAGLVVFVLLAGFILKKSEIAYQNHFAFLALGLLIIVCLLGVVLSLTDINRRIQRRVMDRPMMMGMFRPMGDDGFRGLAGQVLEIGDDFMAIQTPCRKINLLSRGVPDFAIMEIRPGNFIVAVGERRGDQFIAERIRIINEKEIPFLMEKVERKACCCQ